MRANKLKGKIIEKGLSVEQVADKMGIDKSTFYRKLKDFDTFTLGEMTSIQNILELNEQETCSIFLA